MSENSQGKQPVRPTGADWERWTMRTQTQWYGWLSPVGLGIFLALLGVFMWLVRM